MKWLLAASLVVLAPGLAGAQDRKPGTAAPVLRDGSHDFDFEVGDWHARIQRRLHPLTGSNDWVVYEGSSVVRKVWDGQANLGELDIKGPGGSIRGLSLRLYNPATRQWSIRWANSADGDLGTAMVGSFDGDHGYFYDTETLAGRSIQVRFIFTLRARNDFRIEQAFSADGGVTWETNWISDFTR